MTHCRMLSFLSAIKSMFSIPSDDLSDREYVYRYVLAQSWWGLTPTGLFYGFGALAASIDLVFTSEEYAGMFENQHGVFTGVVILAVSVFPTWFLRYYILDAKVYSELQVQIAGYVFTVIGLILGGISLQYKILWLLYIGCAVPCGLGALCLFQRLIFNHQFWFHRINEINLGSGIFGFFIGAWTVIFFLVSIPLLEMFPVHIVIYIYTGVIGILTLYPLMTIDDSRLQRTQERVVIEGTTPKDTDSNGISILSRFRKYFFSSEDIVNGSDKITKSTETVNDTDTITLTTTEMLHCPQTWALFFFFTAVLTPGWGIKLASIQMLRVLFSANSRFSALVTSLYVGIYALGRLFSGMMANLIGVRRTFEFMISIMIITLLILPQTGTNMEHEGQDSAGCRAFVVLICILGLMYGGCIALFYSLVMNVFGPTNYRVSFSLTFKGFALSVILGGISSAYSFSSTMPSSSSSHVSQQHEQQRDSVGATSSAWFYAMAGGVFISLIIVNIIGKHPIDYSKIHKKRIQLIEAEDKTDDENGGCKDLESNVEESEESQEKVVRNREGRGIEFENIQFDSSFILMIEDKKEEEEKVMKGGNVAVEVDDVDNTTKC